MRETPNKEVAMSLDVCCKKCRRHIGMHLPYSPYVEVWCIECVRNMETDRRNTRSELEAERKRNTKFERGGESPWRD